MELDQLMPFLIQIFDKEFIEKKIVIHIVMKRCKILYLEIEASPRIIFIKLESMCW